MGTKGGPRPITILNNRAFKFDSSIKKIETNFDFQELNSATKFTMSFWLKKTASGASDLFSLSNDSTPSDSLILKIVSTDSIDASVNGLSNNFRTNPINLNEWTNVIWMYDGSQLATNRARIYIDGSVNQLISNGVSVSELSSYNKLLIGGDNLLISEIAIWRDVLGSSEVGYVSSLKPGLKENLGNSISVSKPRYWFNSSVSKWNKYGETWGLKDAAGGRLLKSVEMEELDKLIDSPSFNRFSVMLDGIDDYIDCGDSDNLSFGDGTTDSPFSISVWIKPVISAKFRIMFKYGLVGSLKEYYLQVSNGQKLQTLLHDGVATIGRNGSSTVTINNWHHVVMTYDGSGNKNNINLYFNGSLDNSTTISTGTYTAMSNTNEPLYIGSFQSSTPSFAQGRIDEPAIFNSTLSASDVSEIYASGRPAPLSNYSSLVSWLRCGDGDVAPILIDNGNGGNNGVMKNFTTFSTNIPT